MNQSSIRIRKWSPEDTIPTRRPLSLVPIILIVAALSPACTREEAGETLPGARDSVSTMQPDRPQDTDSDSTWSTDPRESSHTITGAALLTDVRAAAQDGFDRIVLEFEQTIPGYRVEYADDPVTQCGSGEAVSVAGVARLRIRLEPANAHTEAGEPTAAPRKRRPGLTALQELESICDFEAHVEWVAGLSNRSGFQVRELTSPARLVIDIAHR